MLHSLESSLIVICRSDRIIFRTFATISKLLDVKGRPARESSLMSSLFMNIRNKILTFNADNLKVFKNVCKIVRLQTDII
jgi:hypothetical protein